MTDHPADPELLPGTAASALEEVRGSLTGVSELGELSQLYRQQGVLLQAQGLTNVEVPYFAQVLEAIQGFGTALSWFPRELAAARPPAADWPKGIWLEIGSFSSPLAPPSSSDFARTVWVSTGRCIWFNPGSKILLSGTSVATTPFEAAVHELGHLTLPRIGAQGIIRKAVESAYGDSDPALNMSLYATESFTEFWAEATAAANTRAFEQVPSVGRPRLRRLVTEVNSHSDVPLL